MSFLPPSGVQVLMGIHSLKFTIPAPRSGTKCDARTGRSIEYHFVCNPEGKRSWCGRTFFSIASSIISRRLVQSSTVQRGKTLQLCLTEGPVTRIANDSAAPEDAPPTTVAGECRFMVIWPTPLACPAYQSAGAEFGVGFGGFGIFLVGGIIVYCKPANHRIFSLFQVVLP